MARSEGDIAARDRDRREVGAIGLTTRAVNVLAQAGARTGAALLAPDLPARLRRVTDCPRYVLDEIASVGEMLAFEPFGPTRAPAHGDRGRRRRDLC